MEEKRERKLPDFCNIKPSIGAGHEHYASGINIEAYAMEEIQEAKLSPINVAITVIEKFAKNLWT